MKKIIEDLYKFGINLLGAGYDNALLWIGKLIDLEIIEIPSGTKFDTWTVPDEWIVKDAWVKFNGEKIIDCKKDPLSLMVYSQPYHGKMNKEEFKKHLYTQPERPDAIEYNYSFYEPKWGFSMPRNKIYSKKIKVKNPECADGKCYPELKNLDPEVGKITIQGEEKIEIAEYEDIIQEGEYEVFIDTEFRKGIMKLGVHTVKGKLDREILLFAHLDHPYQANDNLSGVACLIDLSKKLQDKFEHTIKIIFCPETIGSIGYYFTQDTSKVDFVVAVDICGNDNSLLFQKSYNRFDRVNYATHLAISNLGVDYRKGEFRYLIGSDEYIFNDPQVRIPGIMLSRYPYPEYHTSDDTPEIIIEDKIKEVQDVILKTIEIYEKDYIPVKKFKGPLMRSKYKVQSQDRMTNLNLDYLFYDMDGKKYLSEICLSLGLPFEFAYKLLEQLKKDAFISSFNNRQKGKQKASRKKLSGV